MALEDRFFSKVKKDPRGCWLWQSTATNGAGYGMIRVRGRNEYAHRLSWTLHNKKPIPLGCVIRHSCDNPRCVRPDHLLLGTQRDNVYDMLKRGRFHSSRPPRSIGIDNPAAKLSEDDVSAIRACYATRRFGYRRLSRFFGVTPICIKNVVTMKTWLHVATTEGS